MFKVSTDEYKITIKFKDNSTIKLKVDHEGLFIIINKIRFVSFNKRYKSLVVTPINMGKINFSKLLAVEMGYASDKINKIEFLNGDQMDFRFSNISVVEKVERRSYIFKESNSMIEQSRILPDNKGGYTKTIFQYDDKYSIIEFRNSEIAVQTLLDVRVLDGLVLKNIYLSFNPKLSEYRVVYGNGQYKEPLPRVILNYRGELFVDHINRDTLDNRCKNLRLATRSVNGHNRSKLKDNGFIKGVFESDFRDGEDPRYIVAFMSLDGEKLQEHFSVKRFGYKNALQMAVKRRREWNEKYNVEES